MGVATVPGVARRQVTFLLRQKSNQKRRRPAALLFIFCFLVVDEIALGKRAASKLAGTFI